MKLSNAENDNCDNNNENENNTCNMINDITTNGNDKEFQFCS